MEKIKVTQVRSTIGVIPGHKKTLQALGLRKIGNSRVHDNSTTIKGMIVKVKHLVKVEKA